MTHVNSKCGEMHTQQVSLLTFITNIILSFTMPIAVV